MLSLRSHQVNLILTTSLLTFMLYPSSSLPSPPSLPPSSLPYPPSFPFFIPSFLPNLIFHFFLCISMYTLLIQWWLLLAAKVLSLYSEGKSWEEFSGNCLDLQCHHLTNTVLYRLPFLSKMTQGTIKDTLKREREKVDEM